MLTAKHFRIALTFASTLTQIILSLMMMSSQFCELSVLRGKLDALPSVPAVSTSESHIDDEAIALEAELQAFEAAAERSLHAADGRRLFPTELKVPKCPICDFVLCTRGVCYLCVKHFPSSERVYARATPTERSAWSALVRKRAELHRQAIARAAEVGDLPVPKRQRLRPSTTLRASSSARSSSGSGSRSSSGSSARRKAEVAHERKRARDGPA